MHFLEVDFLEVHVLEEQCFLWQGSQGGEVFLLASGNGFLLFLKAFATSWVIFFFNCHQ